MHKLNPSLTDRHGSTYVIVLGAAMLVMVFMMAGLSIVRIHRLQFENTFDTQQARLNAETALDLGMHYIRSNPSSWRNSSFDLTTHYGSDASMDLQIIDPVDGDVSDSYEDPVELLATGTRGNATQKVRARLNLDAQGHNCLNSAIHAGNDFNIQASHISANSDLSYDNGMTVLQSSTLNCNVTGLFSPTIETNSQITGTITSPGDAPKDLPSRKSIQVIDWYASQAEVILLSDLYESNHSLNRLENSDFRTDLQNWNAESCELARLADGVAVTNRESSLAGIAQDVSSQMYNGGTFRLQGVFNNRGTTDELAQIQLKLESTEDGIQYFSTPTVTCLPREDTLISGDVVPTWQGQLINATWMVTTSGGQTNDYHLSLPIMYETTYPDGAFVIRNTLLNQNYNPFGSGTTQSDGIYLINAANEVVVVENSLISGTLIFQGSSNVSIRKSVHMSNAVYNYPTILTDNHLAVELNSEALREDRTAVNFNPDSSPISADADTDHADSYETRIDGLVYASGNLAINGNLKSKGIWLADGDIVISAAQVDITHNRLYFDEPPPGFVDIQDMRVLPGSIRQVVGNE